VEVDHHHGRKDNSGELDPQAQGDGVYLGRGAAAASCSMQAMSEATDARLGAAKTLGLWAAPCAVAVSAILAGYIPSGSPLDGTYRAIVIALILVLAVEAVLVLMVGIRYAAAITAVLVSIVFKEKELLIGMTLLGGGLVLWSWKHGKMSAESIIESALPVAAGLLLLVTVGSGMVLGVIGLPALTNKAPLGNPMEGARDIIIVVLDGYPRSDTLASAFEFDNGPFIAELEQRGFDVAERSRSNYTLTALTLVSMFQMRHVPDIPSLQGVTGTAEGYRAVSDVLSQPQPAIETLRTHGYEAVAIPAVVNEFKLRGADRDLDSGQMVQLETVILGKTLLAPVVNWIAPDLIWDQQRDRSLDAFRAIEAAAADNRQQFVFAHVMLPHAPFVFGSAGERLPQPPCVPVCSIFEPPPEHDEWLRMLRDQVQFTNDRILALVDGIRVTGADPVIVMMSDHGSRAFAAENPDEMLLNFFAAATPEVPGLFPEDATPINVFPRLLNAYLDERFPLIPDRFFMPDGAGPLQIKPAQ